MFVCLLAEQGQRQNRTHVRMHVAARPLKGMPLTRLHRKNRQLQAELTSVQSEAEASHDAYEALVREKV